MAANIGTPLRQDDPMHVLRNVFRSSPAERSWEPMQFTTADEAAGGMSGDVQDSARSQYSEEYAMDSGRDCFRRRGGYMCVDSDDPKYPLDSDDLEDPVQATEGVPDIIDDLPMEPLPESIYGFAIASLIQDSLEIHEHKGCLSLRPFRIASAFLLCGLTFCMQFLLIYETKKLVTPTDVMHVRRVYGIYEHLMYEGPNGISHTQNTSNGFERGVVGYFNATNFERLNKDDKELVCRIPLSQPVFCFMVLFVWTLTVLAHMRDILNTSLRIAVVKNVTHESMKDSSTTNAEKGDDAVMVQGLTLWMKASIIGLVQFPRLIMCGILLWLGGRWLIATVGFGDLLLNAVALEFILNLAALLYNVLVPYSGKMLVRNTHLPHLHRHEHETCANMFGMLACGFLACILVWIYMYHVQAVLPSYHWDVRRLCAEYLDSEISSLHR